MTDALTNAPVNHVNVNAIGQDFDSAAVFTDSAGFYLRFIEKGTYSFEFSHSGYQDTTINNVSINNYEDKIILNVKLNNAVGIENAINLAEPFISVIPFRNGINIVFNRELGNNANVSIYKTGGKKIKSFPVVKKRMIWDGRDANNNIVSNGYYIVWVQNKKCSFSESFVLLR